MASARLIYAVGGGRGHLARALAYVRWSDSSAPVRIVHSALCAPLGEIPPGVQLCRVSGQSPSELCEMLRRELASRPSQLIVDTFPGGIAHELGDELLGLAEKTTLLRRYVKLEAYPRYHELAARFDDVLLPYGAGSSEWLDDRLVGERPIGPLVRKLAVAASGAPLPLVVVGEPPPLAWLAAASLPTGTRFVRGPVGELPRAAAYLGTAAGYHLAYELAATGVPFGLMPVEKRFDDQYRRAELCGRLVLRKADLGRLLEEAS